MRKILTAGALTAMGLAGLVTPAVADVTAAGTCTAKASKVELVGKKLTGTSTVTCTAAPSELTQFATSVQRKIPAGGYSTVGSPSAAARFGSFTHVTEVQFNCDPGTHTYVLFVTGRTGNQPVPWLTMGPESTITC